LVHVAKLAGHAVHTPLTETNPVAHAPNTGARLHARVFELHAVQVADEVK